MLEINGIRKSFGNKEVLKDFSVSVGPGEIVGLLGKNGAGKTTLIKSIANLYRYEGEIKIEGTQYKDHPKGYLDKVGILLEPSYYEYMSAYRNMAISASLFYKDKKTIDKKARDGLQFIGLQDAANQNVKEFSFGMKQRLGVAMALINDPQLLILDEPTIGVDPKGLALLIDRLKYLAEEKGKTILFSSNNLAEVQSISQRILLMKGGKIAEDRSKEEIIALGNSFKIVLSNLTDGLVAATERSDQCEVTENTIFVQNVQTLNYILKFIAEEDTSVLDIEKDNIFLKNFYD